MPVRTHAKILVVEDSKDVSELLVSVLSRAGFDVNETRGTAEALAVVASWLPDIVVTDCFVPDMFRSFVCEMKSMREGMPVIVLSGDPNHARLLLPEADEFLGKPIPLAELIQTITKFAEVIEADRFGNRLLD